jgi:hypothetical protein
MQGMKAAVSDLSTQEGSFWETVAKQQNLGLPPSARLKQGINFL